MKLHRVAAPAGDGRHARSGAALTIAVLTPTISHRGGGLQDAVRRPSQQLADDADVRLEVFSIADAYSAAERAAWAPLRLSIFSALGPASFGYSRGLYSALRAFAPDVVHVHGLWHYNSIVARRFTRETGVPHVVSPHGMLDSWALQQSRWKKFVAGAAFERAHLSEAACLHALCDAEADSMRAYGLRGPVCVIPNGVDTVAVAESSTRRRPTMLYFGRLHPKKGLTELLHGWRLLRSEEGGAAAGWNLCLAGWGEPAYERHLRTLARELSIEDSVHFAGPQYGAAKETTFSRAGAFILPSKSEGLPMVVLEAWAHGLPVLMTRECHLPAGFAREAALEIGPDSESIAKGMRVIVGASESARRRMGDNGRQLVGAEYSWSVIAVRFSTLYRWLVCSGPAPEGLSMSAMPRGIASTSRNVAARRAIS